MLSQSNSRKQIRKLPRILKFVRIIISIIHYYSKLFTGVLSRDAAPPLPSGRKIKEGPTTTQRWSLLWPEMVSLVEVEDPRPGVRAAGQGPQPARAARRGTPAAISALRSSAALGEFITFLMDDFLPAL